MTKTESTPAGFEPARAKPNRFLIYRLNHSATVSHLFVVFCFSFGPLCLCTPGQSNLFLVGVVGNISACHADARGSIPRLGVFLHVKTNGSTNNLVFAHRRALRE